MGVSYKDIGKRIVKGIGGKENIKSITHCATRLRVILYDKDLVDNDYLESDSTIKGTFYSGGQFQVILGTGVVNKVYQEIIDSGVSETSSDEHKKVKDSQSNKFQRAIRTFGDVFVPIIPALVATGLFLGLRGALLNDQFLSLFGMSVDNVPMSFLAMIDVLTVTTFAFLPTLVCWSTFRVFGGSPILGIVLGLMLVSPSLPNAYSVADPNSGVTPLMIFDFIPLVGYQGSVLPAFLTGLIGAKLEKWLRSKVPQLFDFMVTPFLVLLTMMMLSLMVIGPILHSFEEVVLAVAEGALQLPFGLGGFVIGFSWVFIVITGVHHIFNMLEISMLASTGFNPFNIILSITGFAQAAVCLAIALKARKKSIRALGPGASLSALLGIGEPAIFGVNVRFSIKPLVIGSLISGFSAMIAMNVGLKGTGNGITGIPGTLLYIYSLNQLIGYIAIALFTFALSFTVTWFWGVPKEALEE